MVEYLPPTEGWMSRAELDYLYQRAKEIGGTALEVGCYRGLSTSALAQAVDELYVIDVFQSTPSTKEVNPVETPAAWFANMEKLGLRKKIRLMVMPSNEALHLLREAGEAFGLIFIDGSHDYVDVLSDIRYAMQLVVAGGEIVIDDWVMGNHPGPHKAADEIGGFEQVPGTKMARRWF